MSELIVVGFKDAEEADRVSFLPSGIITNAADAQNKGIEVSLGYRSIPKGNFNYNISANISYNKNTTLALGKGNQVPIKDGNINQAWHYNYTLHKVLQ